MGENKLETLEKNFTIEDLHKRKAEFEALEEEDRKVTAELAKEIERD